jgi:hypothetical protein
LVRLGLGAQLALEFQVRKEQQDYKDLLVCKGRWDYKVLPALQAWLAPKEQLVCKGRKEYKGKLALTVLRVIREILEILELQDYKGLLVYRASQE